MFNHSESFIMSEGPYMKVLGENQLRQIHNSSLKILEDTGMVFDSEEAIDLLVSNGCTKMDEKGRISIPPHLVEKALGSAPSKIKITDRDGEQRMNLSDRNVYFGTGSDLPNVIDPYTGERRKALLKDVANFAKVADYLKNIDFVMAMALASDVANEERDVQHFYNMVTNTTLPILFTTMNLENLKKVYDMALTIRGNEKALANHPFIIHYYEPSSPLQHSKDAIDKLMFCSEKHLPFVSASGTSLGGTAPVTVAGAMAMSNAEFLSSLVLSQLKSEGAPVVYGAGNSTMDMQTTAYLYAAPENWLNGMIVRELSSFYGLPNFGEGGCSDAKIFDQQAGSEIASTLFTTGLIGTNLIHDIGYIDSGMTGSYESLIYSNDVIGSIKRFLDGVVVSEDTLATGVVDDVGPGGNFLTHQHTMSYFEEFIWDPNHFERESYSEWLESGEKTMGEVMNQELKTILEGYTPPELEKNIKAKCKNII